MTQTIIVGRFPPPLDGQAYSTQVTAGLLDDGSRILHRVNVAVPEQEMLSAGSAMHRIRHYMSTRKLVRKAITDAPDASVIWPSISPKPSGHLRDLVSIISAMKATTPILATVHHGDFHRLFERKATRQSARWLTARLRGIVFNSDVLSNRCAPWVPSHKRIVIPNTLGPDVHLTDAAFESARRTRTEGDPIQLLFLSGMIPSKGYNDVLEAVGILHKESFPVEATFIGRWPDVAAKETFMRRVSELGVDNIVHHLGGLSDRAEIQRHYLNADIFLLPTTYPTEAQPLTIVEALNAGTPVISTAHASIPEMIEDGRSGCLVPPHDPLAIAEVVKQFKPLSVQHRFSTEARARYVSYFHPNVIKAKWLEVIDTYLQPAEA